MKNVMFLAVFVIFAIGALYFIQREEAQVHELRTRYEAQIAHLTAANQRLTEQDLAEQQKELVDTDLVSGNRARQAHEQEWKRRSEYDPSFARTAREKTILQISALARDKELPAIDILRRVAILAAPKLATVEVVPTGSGYRLLITFDMSVMTSGEEGALTKHLTIDSLKEEVVEIISRVSKDMYDHCGHKGIGRIAVACTHGVMNDDLTGGGTETKTIYQCAISGSDAKKVPDWRSVPIHKVAGLLQVEHNEFPDLRIDRR